MGATTFTAFAWGRTPEEAFRAACDSAAWERCAATAAVSNGTSRTATSAGGPLKLFEYVNEGPDAPPNPVGASGPDNKGG